MLLSVLLVLDTQLLCADGKPLSLDDYLVAPDDRLLSEIIIKKPFDHCSTGKISHSAAGWSVITAAVAISDNQEYRIALDRVGEKARRLHAIESLTLAGEELECRAGDNVQQLLFNLGMHSVRNSDDGFGFAGSDAILFNQTIHNALLLIATQLDNGNHCYG